MEKEISTRVWNWQHPNAGQNIQQIKVVFKDIFYQSKIKLTLFLYPSRMYLTGCPGLSNKQNSETKNFNLVNILAVGDVRPGPYRLYILIETLLRA